MNSAILLASIIASVGIVYNTFEFYLERNEIFSKFYNWRVVRSRYYILINRPVLSLVFDFVFAEKTFNTLIIVHGLSAIMFPVVFLLNPILASVPALIVLVVHCLSNVRTLVGRDGADQMQNILWAGLFVYCLPLNEEVKTVALAFIAAQLILSYFTSGISKLISPVWRNGSAVHLITRMASYCPAGVAKIFNKRFFSLLFCWLTILFELLSPFLLLFGTEGAIIFIILGIFFHIGIAITMGLTTFVFAFLATYPIVYELAGKL
ncbi:MAG TPA: HTTM domain-containing protein [Chitinophagaceae bacterium]|nr:HTTM domain-containing protein [Chitinophagaceae bacterium]